jgi:precorrin-2/cobalt-factor-2 C20-methyltransferase
VTLFGVGLGPGDAGLVTVRGREVLEAADAVYSPGRLSRRVALEYVEEAQLADLDFPMTRDEDELRRAWKAAAEAVAPVAADGTAAFVTLGDPNVYSTFGHLRRTLARFHPGVDLEVVPGVSAVTAFATALGVEITAGSDLALREAAGGAAPVGPDRLVLFKVTDVPATHEGLREAGYEVTYGRRLFMDGHESVVTSDPESLAERDYYTVAYAEKPGAGEEPATAAFGTEAATDGGEASDSGTRDDERPGQSSSEGLGESPGPCERASGPRAAGDAARRATRRSSDVPSDDGASDRSGDSVVTEEFATAESGGDDVRHE